MNGEKEIDQILSQAEKAAYNMNPKTHMAPNPLMEKVVVPLALVGIGVAVGYLWGSSRRRSSGA